MGNIIKDSTGKVLTANGGAFEVTSSIDSNIQAGNIKKDVTILGVTGTYEGSGGGGGSSPTFGTIVMDFISLPADGDFVLHNFYSDGISEYFNIGLYFYDETTGTASSVLDDCIGATIGTLLLDDIGYAWMSYFNTSCYVADTIMDSSGYSTSMEFQYMDFGNTGYGNLCLINTDLVQSPNTRVTLNLYYTSTSIPEAAFVNSSVQSIILPDIITTIGNSAFENSDLTKCVLPSSITSIGDYAFGGSNLYTLVCLAETPPTLGTDVFDGSNIEFIYVPSNSENAYKTASGWSSYASKIYVLSN